MSARADPAGLTPEALTSIVTSPRAGAGTSVSTSSNTSSPPGRVAIQYLPGMLADHVRPQAGDDIDAQRRAVDREG